MRARARVRACVCASADLQFSRSLRSRNHLHLPRLSRVSHAGVGLQVEVFLRFHVQLALHHVITARAQRVLRVTSREDRVIGPDGILFYGFLQK